MSDDQLAAALEQAANNPGLLPDFYRQLLDSSVWLFVTDAAGETFHQAGALSVAQWRMPDGGGAFVPLFSAPAILPACPESVRPIRLVARDLFRAMPGLHFRLNPHAAPSLDLPPDFVARLVKDGTAHHGVGQGTMAGGTDVQIGPPTESQTVFTRALGTLFARRAPATQVYLFDLHRPEPSGPKHVLAVGIVGPYDMSLAHDISAMLPEAYPGSLPVNVLFLSPGHPILQALVSQRVRPAVGQRTEA